MTRADSPAGGATDYAYDPGSANLMRRRLGNGSGTYFAYDGADRVTAIRHAAADGTPVAYFVYTRDALGRITRLERESDLAVEYSYDAADRLTAEVWRKASDSTQVYAFFYEYDAANNRTKMRREAGAGVETESGYYGYDGVNGCGTL